MTGEEGMASSDFYLTMRRYHGADEREAALALARAEWARRPDGDPVEGDDLAELGEAWRFAMLAATRDGGRPERLVWRVRAQSAFVRSGCRNGIAMLCLPSFFEAVEDDRSSPDEILAILDTIRSLADPGGVGPEPATTVISTVEEKRGYYLTKAAQLAPDLTTRDQLLADAESAYAAALAAEDHPRRQMKIAAGAATSAYLRADGAAGRATAMDRLAGVLEQIDAESIDAADVTRIGRSNLKIMGAGGVELEPYEIV